MMKKTEYILYLTFILLGALSCGPKEEMVLDIQVVNRLDQDIELVTFRTPSSGITVYDSILIPSGQLYEESFYDDGMPDSYPAGPHRLFLSGDSIHVRFNDTLRITHINRFRADTTTEADSARLFVDDARNIFSAESFTKTKVNESVFRGVYMLDTGDFEYALRTY